MAMQESGEMYLETIYVLSQKSATVRAIDIGEYMGYSKPSVSRALGLLKDEGKKPCCRVAAETDLRTGPCLQENECCEVRKVQRDHPAVHEPVFEWNVDK